MGYETSIDDGRGIVEIRFLGAVPHSEHVKARDELLEICRVRKIHKILVDARRLIIRDIPSSMELFDFGVSWAELARRMPVLLAGVLPQDAATRKQLMFGDNVAASRGFVTQIFVDIEEARVWLRNAKN